jgi:hypothetical protein
MPGRAFIGLDPHEKHPGEFGTRRLPDAPQITVWLVVGAVATALVVIVIGSMIHADAAYLKGPVDGVCWDGSTPAHIGQACPKPETPGIWIPMVAWYLAGALAATLVLATPFLVYEFKRQTGGL